MHTTASDGTWGPERLVKELKEKGINIFSVTDHNSVENVEKVSSLAVQSGLKIIPAVEVDVSHRGGSYHILGYGVDIKNPSLLFAIEKNRSLMDEKDDESVRYIENRGLGVSLKEYREYVNDPSRGGWKALNYFIDKGLCKNYIDFFNLFSDYGNPFDKMVFISPSEAIRAIDDAGGIPVLAHPGASFYNSDYKWVVSFMLDYGIKGIECFHPDNSKEITQYCLGVCNTGNLFITGGSDCHGHFVGKRKIGLPDIRLSQIRLPQSLILA